jgi:hypothetical protein
MADPTPSKLVSDTSGGKPVADTNAVETAAVDTNGGRGVSDTSGG